MRPTFGTDPIVATPNAPRDRQSSITTLVDAGVAAVRDDGQRCRLPCRRVATCAPAADHGRHGRVDDDVTGHVPPQHVAGGRRGTVERGKSDPIDALAVARAALREPDLPCGTPGWSSSERTPAGRSPRGSGHRTHSSSKPITLAPPRALPWNGEPTQDAAERTDASCRRRSPCWCSGHGSRHRARTGRTLSDVEPSCQ